MTGGAADPGDRTGTGACDGAEGCAHAAAKVAAAIVRIGYLATTPLRRTIETATSLVCEPRSAHGNMITQDSVSRVQDGHGRAATRIGLGKVAAHEAIVLSIFAYRDGHEHQVRVEGANMFYPEELELERAFCKVIQRAERRFRGNSEVAEGTRLTQRPSVEELPFPLQCDISGALA